MHSESLPSPAPEKLVLSRESAELVDDALALVCLHGPVYALKWLAAQMEQKAKAGQPPSMAPGS